MSKPHLILLLDAPLMAFGGVAVDSYGRTDPFPSASLLTGLIGNALGYDRTEGEKLQALQDRLVYAVRIDQPGLPLMDYQNAELFAKDEGWTTRGVPEGRNRVSPSYTADARILRRTGKLVKRMTHQRYRHFWADRVVRVALRLEPAEAPPTLDDVAAALDAPARPLFIGRKPCLPSGPILAGRAEASNARAALETLAPYATLGDVELFWPDGEGGDATSLNAFNHTGRRDWTSGVHGGWERWKRGMIAAGTAP